MGLRRGLRARRRRGIREPSSSSRSADQHPWRPASLSPETVPSLADRRVPTGPAKGPAKVPARLARAHTDGCQPCHTATLSVARRTSWDAPFLLGLRGPAQDTSFSSSQRPANSTLAGVEEMALHLPRAFRARSVHSPVSPGSCRDPRTADKKEGEEQVSSAPQELAVQFGRGTSASGGTPRTSVMEAHGHGQARRQRKRFLPACRARRRAVRRPGPWGAWHGRLWRLPFTLPASSLKTEPRPRADGCVP